MEQLKRLEDIFQPDQRSMFTQKVEFRYKELYSISLNEMVPDEVVSQFNIARNLALYSWFCYPFHQISELKAFSTLEFALKIKYPKIRGLANLIKAALEEGLLNDYGFSHIEVNPADPNEYTRDLRRLIPKMRNNLAHGSNKLAPVSLLTLSVCSDFINQVFAGPATPPNVAI